jgi:hypothetical protein
MLHIADPPPGTNRAQHAPPPPDRTSGAVVEATVMDRITMDGRSLPERIGEAAGRVWRQLRAHGPHAVRDLAHAIGRNEIDVYMAIGWLAREGKLRQEGDRFALVEHEMSISF